MKVGDSNTVSGNPEVSLEASLTAEQNALGNSISRIVNAPYDLGKKTPYVDLTAYLVRSQSQHDLKTEIVKSEARFGDVNTLRPDIEQLLATLPSVEQNDSYTSLSSEFISNKIESSKAKLKKYSSIKDSFSTLTKLPFIDGLGICYPPEPTSTRKKLKHGTIPEDKSSRAELLSKNNGSLQRQLIKKTSFITSHSSSEDESTPLCRLHKVNLEQALDKIIALKDILYDGYNPPKTGYEASRTGNEGSADFMLNSAELWLNNNAGNNIYTEAEIKSFEVKLATAKDANSVSIAKVRQWEEKTALLNKLCDS